MAAPFLEFDLPAELNRLHAETTWNTGQNAKTLIKYDDFRVVLPALQASARIPEHKAEGRISIHVLSGHLQLKASGRTFSLRPGGLLALDQGVSSFGRLVLVSQDHNARGETSTCRAIAC